ncbi:MAG: T9SS type A sorting domain-containing protein [Ignavibacteriales bacterium]|nr:T9SS type A sorting domain-containing protein [Ignavibacteriales bacterium]
MKITNSQGQSIGYYNGFLIEDIPGAEPIIEINGSLGPPNGYELPLDNYSIETNKFTNDTVAVYFFGGQKSFIISRFGADSLETDQHYFDGGVSFKNPDLLAKSIRIENLIGEAGQDKIFILNSISVPQNDSVKVENPDNEKLKFISYGSNQQYDIQLNFVSENELGLFGYSDIDLPAHSAHTFVPDWTDLTNLELQVLVDIGNDGTIDDTLTLFNQVTGLQNHGSLQPNEFRLEQNYPNPFNPNTKIKYTIPNVSQSGVEGSRVQLKVYDVLGNEVATLVNETKPAGTYEVEFNASNLSSGVYFYKLQSGSFVETRKMILLK